MRWLARLYLWLSGWRADGKLPTYAKYVLVAAPHTSNWDLPHMLAIGFFHGLRVRWLGKRELFRGPLGPVLRWFGGMAVDRSTKRDVVAQTISAFDAAASFVLVVPPEGTRGGGEYWKSGFYHIASGAQVPIVLGFLDYARKRGGFGPTVVPAGDLAGDMDTIRRFYATVTAKYPSSFRTPRLREEATPAVAPPPRAA